MLQRWSEYVFRNIEFFFNQSQIYVFVNQIYYKIICENSYLANTKCAIL